VKGFEDLLGLTVTSWNGREWAIRTGDEPDSESQFEDPTVPCLQFLTLFPVIESGLLARIVSEQQDDGWGLAMDHENWIARGSAGAVRERESLSLPTGQIESVDVRVEDALISEVLLRIGGTELLLVAGEVGDAWGEPLQWHRFDEEVLAFLDPSDADRIDWIPPRGVSS
jgi:hypothetical protein